MRTLADSFPVEHIIVRASHVVRALIEDFASTLSPLDVNDENLQGACGISSYVLARVLRRLGVEAHLVMGRWVDESHQWDSEHDNHCWVEIPSKKLIVDITATQFGVSSRVYITTMGSGTYVANRRGPRAVRRLSQWAGQSHSWYVESLREIETQAVETVRAKVKDNSRRDTNQLSQAA